MLRKLFLREYFKSLVAHAGIYASFRLTLFLLDSYAVRRGWIKSGDTVILDSYLLIGLIASGLISGERCFSAAFKEGYYLFLASLPVSRARIWLALSLSRLAGAVSILPIVLVTLPSLLAWPRRELDFQHSSLALAVVCLASIYLVTFAGGLTLAFAFRHELVVYLVGVPLLSLLVPMAWNLPPYYWDTSRIHVLRSMELLGLVGILTASSLRSFVRADFRDQRQRTRRFVILGLSLIFFFGLSLFLARSTTIAAVGDRWSYSSVLTHSQGRAVSRDGRTLAIVSFLNDRPNLRRLQIWDLEAGRITSKKFIPAISQVIWSDSLQVFNVVAPNWPAANDLGLSNSAATDWYRLSRDGKVVMRRRLPGQATLHELISGRILLILQNKGTGRGFIFNEEDRTLRRVFEGPLPDFPGPYSKRLANGDEIHFGGSANRTIWELDTQGSPVKKYKAPKPDPRSLWLNFENIELASRRGVPALSILDHPSRVAVSPLAVAYATQSSGLPAVAISSNRAGCPTTPLVCRKGENALVDFHPFSGWEKTLVEIYCRDKEMRIRKRYWLYQPGPGSLTALEGLPEEIDLIEPGQDGSILWWTDNGEIWRSVNGRQPYRIGAAL